MGTKSSPARASNPPHPSAVPNPRADPQPTHSSRAPALPLFRVYFLWFVQSSHLYHRLGTDISREICLYYQFGSPKIVTASSNWARYLNLETKTWSTMFKFKNTLCQMEYSAVLWISDDYVFKCGGYEKPMVETRAAYLLSRDFVTELNEMSVPRTFHGIAFALHTSSIFVFGGHHGSSTSHTDTLISAEKFSILTEQWTPLPDMLDARYCFQPCISGRTIVLCGGNKAGSCELFDIDRREYRRLEIVTSPGVALTVTDGEWLITHSTELYQRWSLTSPDIVSRYDSSKVVWCPCPAVRLTNCTIYYTYDQEMVQIITDEQVTPRHPHSLIDFR